MYDENKEYIIQLINDVRKEQKIDIKIQGTLILMNILYPPKNAQMDKIRKTLQQLNKNHEFRRKTKYKNTITDNQQDALLYYGEDYTGDDDYTYQTQQEETNMKIEEIINHYLSWAYKHTLQEDLDL